MNFNALGQALESCKGSKDGVTSISSKIINENSVELCYTCVVHFAAEQAFRNQLVVETHRAKSMLKEAVKSVSKEYKSLAKADLTTKTLKESDDIEIIQVSTTRKVAYYRYRLLLSVE